MRRLRPFPGTSRGEYAFPYINVYTVFRMYNIYTDFRILMIYTKKRIFEAEV
jgi:hypothetical protein